jgi:uncharacterized Rmd1/YagE family protein
MMPDDDTFPWMRMTKELAKTAKEGTVVYGVAKELLVLEDAVKTTIARTRELEQELVREKALRMQLEDKLRRMGCQQLAS